MYHKYSKSLSQFWVICLVICRTWCKTNTKLSHEDLNYLPCWREWTPLPLGAPLGNVNWCSPASSMGSFPTNTRGRGDGLHSSVPSDMCHYTGLRGTPKSITCFQTVREVRAPLYDCCKAMKPESIKYCLSSVCVWYFVNNKKKGLISDVKNGIRTIWDFDWLMIWGRMTLWAILLYA